jgi:hypothetical protein
MIASDLLRKSPETQNILDSNTFDIILKCIERHSGQWTKASYGRELLEKPETLLEILVHMADYNASRQKLLDVSLNYYLEQQNTHI